MRLAVGRIGRPHGIRGEVTVEVTTDDPDTRFAVGATLLTDPAERGPLTVTGTGRSGHITVLRLRGVEDRDTAERLRGTILEVDTEDLPELADPDDYYDHQLIGLIARDVGGVLLGEVTAILHAPAAPVLTVTRPDGSAELVPFVAAIVPEVDLAARTITIAPPDGMFS